METYNIVPSQGRWGVSQNKNRPEGVTRSEKAHFEAIYLAASNDIKKGRGGTIVNEPARATNLPPAGRHEPGGA